MPQNNKALVPGARELIREGILTRRENRPPDGHGIASKHISQSTNPALAKSNCTPSKFATVGIEGKQEHLHSQGQPVEPNFRTADERASLLCQVRSLELRVLRRDASIAQLAGEYDVLIRRTRSQQAELDERRKREEDLELKLSRVLRTLQSNHTDNVGVRPRSGTNKKKRHARKRILANLSRRLARLGFDDDSDSATEASIGSESDDQVHGSSDAGMDEEDVETDEIVLRMSDQQPVQALADIVSSLVNTDAQDQMLTRFPPGEMVGSMEASREPSHGNDTVLDRYEEELSSREHLIQQQSQRIEQLEVAIKNLESTNVRLNTELASVLGMLNQNNDTLAASKALESSQADALDEFQKQQIVLESCIAQAKDNGATLQCNLLATESQLSATQLQLKEEQEKSQAMWHALVAQPSQPCDDCVALQTQVELLRQIVEEQANDTQHSQENIESSSMLLPNAESAAVAVAAAAAESEVSGQQVDDEAALIYELAITVHKQAVELKSELSVVLQRRMRLLREESVVRERAVRATQELRDEMTSCRSRFLTTDVDVNNNSFGSSRLDHTSQLQPALGIDDDVSDKSSADGAISGSGSDFVFEEACRATAPKASLNHEFEPAVPAHNNPSSVAESVGEKPWVETSASALPTEFKDEEAVSPTPPTTVEHQPSQRLVQHAVKTGYLMVGAGNGVLATMKRRWIVLSPDLLLVFQTRASKVPHRVAGLRNARIRRRQQRGLSLAPPRCALELTTGAELSLLLRAATQEETAQWEVALEDCIVRLRGIRTCETSGLLNPATGELHCAPVQLAESYYAVLGVAGDASHEDIARSFRACIANCSPDEVVTSEDKDNAGSSSLRSLLSAWSVLGDPLRRAAYDQGVHTHRKLTRGFVCALTQPSSSAARLLKRVVPWSRHRAAGPCVSGPVFLYADVRLTRLYWQACGAKACLFDLAHSVSLRAVRRATPGEDVPGQGELSKDQCVVLEMEERSTHILCIVVDSQAVRDELLLGLHALLPWLRA